MQKAVKLIVIGMAMGMVAEKCFKKMSFSSTDEPNKCSCIQNDNSSNSLVEGSDCKRKTKLDQLIEEFDKIDLSEVKEKTKQALEKFKIKLQSM